MGFVNPPKTCSLIPASEPRILKASSGATAPHQGALGLPATVQTGGLPRTTAMFGLIFPSVVMWGVIGCILVAVATGCASLLKSCLGT